MKKSQCMIWQVLDTRRAGGIESHVFELTLNLCKKGWPVCVVFINDFGAHPLKKDLDKHNITWFCLDGQPTGLWRALTLHHPQILHTHGYKAGVLGRICARLQNIQVVSTFHAGEKTTGKLALYTLLDRMTAGLSKAIAVSQKIARTLPTTATQINNFVTLPTHLPLPYKGRVGFVGRLSQEKGPDIFCKIARSIPSLRFDIYGDGPMRPALEKQYAKNVTFHGQVNMDEHWHNIDLVCMPSRFEGLPLAALEAMARSIPVLAAKVGGLPHLIQHHHNGWLADIEDINTFTDLLNHWRIFKSLQRSDYGKAARKTIKDFYSPEVVLPQIEDIYEKAVGD